MKYEVGDEIEILLYYKNPRFKIEEVDASRHNPYKVKGSWWPESSLKLIEKNLNGGTIDTKDHRQDPDNGLKYSTEQVAYLDQCAIAAMREIMSSNHYTMHETSEQVAGGAYHIAEVMLQERTKRLEK